MQQCTNLKNNIMSNLLELAIAQTSKNITKSQSSRKSIGDSLVELLYGENKLPMTKVEVVGNIALERLENETENLTPKKFMTDEVQKEFKRLSKTVSNGFDTCVCDGKTNASFSKNPKYSQYLLVKLNDGRYTVEDREQK